MTSTTDSEITGDDVTETVDTHTSTVSLINTDPVTVATNVADAQTNSSIITSSYDVTTAAITDREGSSEDSEGLSTMMIGIFAAAGFVFVMVIVICTVICCKCVCSPRNKKNQKRGNNNGLSHAGLDDNKDIHMYQPKQTKDSNSTVSSKGTQRYTPEPTTHPPVQNIHQDGDQYQQIHDYYGIQTATRTAPAGRSEGTAWNKASGLYTEHIPEGYRGSRKHGSHFASYDINVDEPQQTQPAVQTARVAVQLHHHGAGFTQPKDHVYDSHIDRAPAVGNQPPMNPGPSQNFQTASGPQWGTHQQHAASNQRPPFQTNPGPPVHSQVGPPVHSQVGPPVHSQVGPPVHSHPAPQVNSNPRPQAQPQHPQWQTHNQHNVASHSQNVANPQQAQIQNWTTTHQEQASQQHPRPPLLTQSQNPPSHHPQGHVSTNQTVMRAPRNQPHFIPYTHPNQQYQAPNQQYQPPNQQYQQPNQQYQPPNQQYQPPNQQYQPPNLQYQPPNQQYQPPNQQYQPRYKKNPHSPPPTRAKPAHKVQAGVPENPQAQFDMNALKQNLKPTTPGPKQTENKKPETEINEIANHPLFQKVKQVIQDGCKTIKLYRTSRGFAIQGFQDDEQEIYNDAMTSQAHLPPDSEQIMDYHHDDDTSENIYDFIRSSVLVNNPQTLSTPGNPVEENPAEGMPTEVLPEEDTEGQFYAEASAAENQQYAGEQVYHEASDMVEYESRTGTKKRKLHHEEIKEKLNNAGFLQELQSRQVKESEVQEDYENVPTQEDYENVPTESSAPVHNTNIHGHIPSGEYVNENVINHLHSAGPSGVQAGEIIYPPPGEFGQGEYANHEAIQQLTHRPNPVEDEQEKYENQEEIDRIRQGHVNAGYQRDYPQEDYENCDVVESLKRNKAGAMEENVYQNSAEARAGNKPTPSMVNNTVGLDPDLAARLQERRKRTTLRSDMEDDVLAENVENLFENVLRDSFQGNNETNDESNRESKNVAPIRRKIDSNKSSDGPTNHRDARISRSSFFEDIEKEAGPDNQPNIGAWHQRDAVTPQMMITGTHAVSRNKLGGPMGATNFGEDSTGAGAQTDSKTVNPFKYFKSKINPKTKK